MLAVKSDHQVQLDSCNQGNHRYQTSPPVHNLLSLYTTTRSNSVALPGDVIHKSGSRRA